MGFWGKGGGKWGDAVDKLGLNVWKSLYGWASLNRNGEGGGLDSLRDMLLGICPSTPSMGTM